MKTLNATLSATERLRQMRAGTSTSAGNGGRNPKKKKPQDKGRFEKYAEDLKKVLEIESLESQIKTIRGKMHYEYSKKELINRLASEENDEVEVTRGEGGRIKIAGFDRKSFSVS